MTYVSDDPSTPHPSMVDDDDRGPAGLVPERLSDVAESAFSIRQISLGIGDAGRGSAFSAVLQLNDRLKRTVARHLRFAPVAT